MSQHGLKYHITLLNNIYAATCITVYPVEPDLRKIYMDSNENEQKVAKHSNPNTNATPEPSF